MKSHRKAILAVVLVCFIGIIFLNGPCAGESRRPDLMVTFNTKVLVDVNPRDASAAVKLYSAELAGQIGRTADSYIYQNLEEVVKDIQAGKADLIGMSSLDYLRIKSKIDVVLALGYTRGGKTTLKYLLITHQKRGYNKLGDLRNKKLTMPKEDDMAALFLDTLLLRQKYGEMKGFFSSIEEKGKASQTVLPVFFGQADACIINDVAFKTMVELNPQLGKDLKILSSSQELTVSVTVFRRGLSDDVKKNTVAVARSLRDNARGRQVLTLFKVEALTPVKETDLTNVRDLLNEYNRLKRKK